MNLTAKQQLSRNPSNAGYATPLKTYSVPASTNEDGTISVPAQPVYGIDPDHEPIDTYMKVRTVNGGTLTQLPFFGGLPAGGAPITLGARTRVRLVSFICDVTATATVGNRILQFRINSQGYPQFIGAASTAITAAQVGGYDVYFGNPASTPSTTVRRNIANTGNVNVMVRESAPAVEIWNLTDAAVNIGGIDDSADIDVADATNCVLNVISYPV